MLTEKDRINTKRDLKEWLRYEGKNYNSIGKDCVFHINTALVAGGTTDGVPWLDDGVIVGIGAIIVGNVHIAANVAVGANSVVNKDVTEKNIAVAGVPAHKISNRGRLNWN